MAYYGRAYANFSPGHKEAAITDFDRAIDKNNNYAFAYAGRGEVYFSLQNYKKAMDDYNQFLKLNGNTLTDEQKKYYEDKLQKCEEALRINDPATQVSEKLNWLGIGELDKPLIALLVAVLTYSLLMIILAVRERNLKYAGTFLIADGIIVVVLMVADSLGVRNVFIVIAVGYILLEIIRTAELFGIPALEWLKNILQKLIDLLGRPPR